MIAWTHTRRDKPHANTHQHAQTERERNHIVYLVTSLQQKKRKKKGHRPVGVCVTQEPVSMTQMYKYITLLLHLHEQSLLRKNAGVLRVPVFDERCRHLLEN